MTSLFSLPLTIFLWKKFNNDFFKIQQNFTWHKRVTIEYRKIIIYMIQKWVYVRNHTTEAYYSDKLHRRVLECFFSLRNKLKESLLYRNLQVVYDFAAYTLEWYGVAVGIC